MESCKKQWRCDDDDDDDDDGVQYYWDFLLLLPIQCYMPLGVS